MGSPWRLIWTGRAGASGGAAGRAGVIQAGRSSCRPGGTPPGSRGSFADPGLLQVRGSFAGPGWSPAGLIDF